MGWSSGSSTSMEIPSTSNAESIEDFRSTAWHVEQERIADNDLTPQARLDLIIRQGRFEFAAGLLDKALDTLELAHWDAMNRDDFKSARQLEDVIDDIRTKGVWSK